VMGWFSAQQRGFALGVRQTAVPVGGAIAALVLPVLETPRAGLLFVAGFVLVGALVGALVLRKGSEEHIETADVEMTLRDRRLWVACWGSGLYLIAQTAMMGFVVLFLHDEHGFSTGEAAAVFAAGQVLAGVLRIVVGRWSDVVGSRVRPLRLIGISIGVALFAVAVVAEAPGLLLVPVLALATGMSMAWNGLSYTIAAELGGRRSGAAIGFQQTVLSAIGIAAPVGFAAAVSATSWAAAFGLAALFPLVGVWMLRSL
jgi:sugar phosphate permease